MKISCPTCAAKYSVADEKIQSRLAKIRCRKCSSTIVIDGTAAPARVYIGESGSLVSGGPPPDVATEAAAGSGRPGAPGADRGAAGADPVGPAPDEYAVDIADNDQRNMTIHQIVGAYNEGLITADTYIWKEGMADWQTVSEVREVASALQAAGSRPVAAAVRRADNAPAKDLFGAIDRAGGEDDITTSAPEPQPAFTAGTGARNESSVLFSLSALTGSAEQSSSSKRSKPSADDSGLIDLQALTAAGDASGAGAAAPGGVYGASPLISAPLGGVSGPVIGATLGGPYGQRSGGRLGLIIAAIIVAAGMIGGVALFLNKGGAEQEPTTSLAAPAPAEKEKPAGDKVEPAASKEDPGAEAAKAAAEPEAERDSVAVAELPTAAPEPATPRATTPRPTTRPKPAAAPRAKPQPAPAAAPAPAPEPAPAPPKPAAAAEEKKKPAAPRCDCKPADLMCAMRCSAKK